MVCSPGLNRGGLCATPASTNEFVAATHSVQELKGMFGTPAKPVSIDEMNKAVAPRGAAAR